MIIRRCGRWFVLTLLLLAGAAFSQSPLTGTFAEPTIGFLFVFQDAPGGGVNGVIVGQDGPLQLTIRPDPQFDGRSARGAFVAGGMNIGFTAQLQPDGVGLAVTLFQLDGAGQPVAGSYEYYMAVREAQTAASPFPAAPQGAPAGAPTQAPPTQAAPLFPPAQNTPPTQGFPPAQGGAPMQTGVTGAPSIVGTWQGVIDQQGLQIIAVTTFNADGTYRDEAYLDGQLMLFYTGTYSFAPDGSLTKQVTGASPQVCARGNCQPNQYEPTEFGRIDFLGPNTAVYTEGVGAEATQLRFERR
ncbi:MAG: hypothetical protein KF875_11665 [Trueperaceae bacterium]|nr:hypothetical protein [Trueperaceae bacterium]MCC6310211.1 hypothetical protein [Trueperaceae bacterium]MCO5173192.1 hypothetical protein [Trueperaceae bacterium]MCW5818406.1 hypothetical protein [Trueperaceae bacterium]